MLGAVLGILGSYIGMSKVIEKSVNENQKKQLISLRNKTALQLFITGILLTLSYELTAGWLMPCLCFIVLFLVIYRSTKGVNKLVYMASNKTGFINEALITQSSKDKFWCQFGLIIGFLGGGSGLLIGLYNSGRFATFL